MSECIGDKCEHPSHAHAETASIAEEVKQPVQRQMAGNRQMRRATERHYRKNRSRIGKQYHPSGAEIIAKVQLDRAKSLTVNSALGSQSATGN